MLEELRGAGEPRGIGLSGQMHGLVALDSADRVLRPAILWNDQRTAAECAEIEERIGLAELIARTGNRALTGFTAPKLLWMRRHEPELYGRIESVLLPKDYVRLRLCGEKAMDVADASGTLLFDVAHRRWAIVGARRARAGRGVAAAHARVARASGHVDGVPVAAGAGDQAAGALGVGVDRPGPGLGGARHLRGRVRGAGGVRRRPGGAPAHVLPRGARRLARHGRDALGGGLAALAARRGGAR